MEQIALPSITEIEILEELDRLCVSFASLGPGGFMEVFSWHPSRRVAAFHTHSHVTGPVGKSLPIWDDSGSLGHITVPEPIEQMHTVEGKRICQEIKHCLSRLQFENQRTSQRRFVDGLLHDVRGPLRRVSGIVSFIAGSNELPAELSGCLDKEVLSAEWVLQQAGVVASTLRAWSDDRCDPRHAWNEAAYRVQHLYAELPVEFILESDYTGFAPLSEDSLSELFVQLIHNSLKFGGSPCKINISMTAGPFVENGDADEGLLIHFYDNGASLDPQYFPKIFQPFYRGHAPSFAGAGLGLYACRQIARRARGFLEAQQDANSGALHLTLWFPSV